jgi:hypothetical protein
MLDLQNGSSFNLQLTDASGELRLLGPFLVRDDLNFPDVQEAFARFLHKNDEYTVLKLVQKVFGGTAVSGDDLTSACFAAWLIERKDIQLLSIGTLAFKAEKKKDGVIDIVANHGGDASSYTLDPSKDYISVIWHFNGTDSLMETSVDMRKIEAHDPFEDPIPVRVAAELLRERAMLQKGELEAVRLPHDNGTAPNGDRVVENKVRNYKIGIKEPVEFAGEYAVTLSYSEIHRAPTRRNPEGSKSNGYGARANLVTQMSGEEKSGYHRLLARTVLPADVHNLFKFPDGQVIVPVAVRDIAAHLGSNAQIVLSPEGDLGFLAICEVGSFPEERGFQTVLSGNRAVFRISRWEDRDVNLLASFVDASDLDAVEHVISELHLFANGKDLPDPAR